MEEEKGQKRPLEEDESCLLSLADELIDMVLSYPVIDHQDLCRCAQVCRRLHRIAMGNEVWKKKSLLRWNFWKNVPGENWSTTYRDRFLMEQKIHHTLQTISRKYYTKVDVYKKDLKRFVDLAKESPWQSCHIGDSLHELLQGDVCKVNLTYRYYARKVNSYLKIDQLKDEWEQFLVLPDEQQPLEKEAKKGHFTLSFTRKLWSNLTIKWNDLAWNDLTMGRNNSKPSMLLNCPDSREKAPPSSISAALTGAMLIARWILDEEEIDENSTFAELDEIAKMVQDSLGGNLTRGETVLTTAPEERMSISTEESAPAVTHPAACLRIIDCLKQVLYQQLQFKGNVNDYYKKENSMLHQVLKNRTGNPITLSVLFAGVARRLGVKLEPVNFPSHFLLRWRTNLDPEADQSTAYKYIDCFNGGRLLSEGQCIDLILPPSLDNSSLRKSAFIKATPKEVFIRMVANIVNSYRAGDPQDNGLKGLHSSLNLALLLDPSDESSRLLVARIQLHLGVDLDEAIFSLEILQRGGSTTVRDLLERAKQKKAEQDQADDTPQPKLRSDPGHSEVGFKVGMVMRHKLYNYGCVIYGWDPVCKMDELWIRQMGVDNSPGGRNQPFYNVLGDDGSRRYAAHTNLREDPQQPFNPHPELGKYFKGFTGTRYIPNESLQQEYPEDVFSEENP